MAKRKYNLIAAIFLMLLIAGATAFHFYNKGPLDVSNSKGLAVNANELYGYFSTDTAKAHKKYSGKVLAVAGLIADISANQQDEMLVLLKTDETGAYLNCTLTKKNTSLGPGDSIIVKGICSGIGQGDKDLGIKADVYLTRCVIEDKM